MHLRIDRFFLFFQLEDCVDDEEGVIYELVGVVSHVSDPRFPDKNNLVACIKVGPSYHVRAKVSSVSHWYLLNDIRYVLESLAVYC